MIKNCALCGPSETEVNDSMGHVVCLNCGNVLEENTIVSEMTFTESGKGATVADGFQLQQGQARAKSRVGGQGRLSQSQDSRTNTLNNGNRKIQELANAPQIRIPERLVAQAQRLFKLAVESNFTKGRKATSVTASCLYIVCRMNKTAHMLIDFSDALNENVYELGSTFLALLPLVVGNDENIPIVEPALFISRFAARLDFGNKTQDVIRDAVRVVQRMERDWMATGRRPSGICAAGLFVAARMNGFKRSLKEIMLVVKICEGTLRMRLKELQETPSGQLTVGKFQEIWLETAHDPPSFTHNKKRKHEHQEPVPQEEVDEVRNILTTQASTFPASYHQTHEEQELDAGLSDLDDDREIKVILSVSENERAFKEQVWIQTNSEWIAKQEEKILRGDVPQKKEKKPRKQQDPLNAQTASEAARVLLQSKPALSKKINYQALDTLLESTPTN